MGVIIYSFNLNISPKMSYGVHECDIVTELHAYDFVIKDFIIKNGCYLCWTLYVMQIGNRRILELYQFQLQNTGI